jgi:hypothetical protein
VLTEFYEADLLVSDSGERLEKAKYFPHCVIERLILRPSTFDASDRAASRIGAVNLAVDASQIGEEGGSPAETFEDRTYWQVNVKRLCVSRAGDLFCRSKTMLLKSSE